MKLTIVLKKQDAIGLGGQILEAMGMKRSVYEPEVFVAQHIADPRIIAPVDVTDSMWPIMYVEALMDEGIRPVRVMQKDNSVLGLTPLFASTQAPAKPSNAAVADLLDAAANALEAGGPASDWEKALGLQPGEAYGADENVPSDLGKVNIQGYKVHFAQNEETSAVVGWVEGLGNVGYGYSLQEAKGDANKKLVTLNQLLKDGVDPDDALAQAMGRKSRRRASVKASKGVISPKDWKMIREKANAALEKAGFDGNGRFKTIGQANSKLADVLSNFGLQLADVMSADLFREDARVQNFGLEFVNEEDSFSPVTFDDSMMHFSYAKLSPDRIEVVAYLS